VFHMDVVKVDRDAALCCNTFICFFRHKLQVCLSGCCICFTHMLQVTHLNIAYACNGFQVFFSSVLQVFWTYVAIVSYVSHVCCKCFSWILQKHMSVAHVAMPVKSGGDASGPRARSIGVTMYGQHGPHVGARNVGVGEGVLARGRTWSAEWAFVKISRR
jgi:hypothetical protein